MNVELAEDGQALVRLRRIEHPTSKIESKNPFVFLKEPSSVVSAAALYPPFIKNAARFLRRIFYSGRRITMTGTFERRVTRRAVLPIMASVIPPWPCVPMTTRS